MIAAVSVGVVDGRVRLDLPYEEDSRAEVDMNVVMTGEGRFVEVQGTAEGMAFSRGELADLAGLDPGRITVIPGGVDARFDSRADAVSVAARLGLERPYVLSVATADRRKNVEKLAAVAAALRDDGIDLVWAGDRRPYFQAASATSGVRDLGYIPDADLPGLYAGARAFVLSSRYEGFGLTCLEAMACGTPVVAADRAALPETCGDAALLVDPDDSTALTQAVLIAVWPPRRGMLSGSAPVHWC